MFILAFLNGIFLRFIGLALSAVMVWGIPASSGTPIEARDSDNLKLQASIVADIHMQSFDYQNYYQLTLTLRDIANSKQQQDALILVGDNTMNGQITEYIMLYGLLSQYSRVKNTLVVMGNHDLNIGELGAETGIRRHNFFLRSYTGIANDKAYYSQVINGYTFITLAGEGPDSEREISDAQLAWLAETMEKSSDGGLPIFVFVHQSIGWFPRYEELQAIFEGYPNVFVFNGHWHTPLRLSETNGVNYVNLPSIHPHNESQPQGEGLQLEVYEDKVLLRGRDYMKGEWLPTEYTVELMLGEN